MATAGARLGDATADDVGGGDDRHVQPGPVGREIVAVTLGDDRGRDEDPDARERPDDELARLEELLLLRGLRVAGDGGPRARDPLAHSRAALALALALAL